VRIVHCQEDMEDVEATKDTREAFRRVKAALEGIRTDLSKVTRQFPMRPSVGDSPSQEGVRRAKTRKEREQDAEDSESGSDEERKAPPAKRARRG
jgi:hypothetical protein